MKVAVPVHVTSTMRQAQRDHSTRSTRQRVKEFVPVFWRGYPPRALLLSTTTPTSPLPPFWPKPCTVDSYTLSVLNHRINHLNWNIGVATTWTTRSESRRQWRALFWERGLGAPAAMVSTIIFFNLDQVAGVGANKKNRIECRTTTRKASSLNRDPRGCRLGSRGKSLFHNNHTKIYTLNTVQRTNCPIYICVDILRYRERCRDQGY